MTFDWIFLLFGALFTLYVYVTTVKPPTWLLFSKLVHAVVGHWTILFNKSFSVADGWDSQVKRDPNAIALVFEEKTYTFNDIDKLSNKVANWAVSAGIKPNDTIALLMSNRLEYVTIRLGLLKIGAKIALLNSNVMGIPLAHVLTTSTASILILGSEQLKNYRSLADLPSVPSPDAPHVPKLQAVWVHSETGTDENEWKGQSEFKSLNDAFAKASDKNMDFKKQRAPIKLTDVAYLIYTSGTTGLPKAAKVTHKRIDMFSRFVCALLDITVNDRIYITLPLYHTNGGVLGFSSWHVGGGVVLSRKFSASRCLDEAKKGRGTIMIYIGELLRYMYAQPPKPSDRDHHIRLVVGNGLRPDIWREFQSRFNIKDIREFYGSTEGNVVLMNIDNKVGCCGFVPRTRLIPAFLMGLVFKGALVSYDVAKDEHPRNSSGLCIRCPANVPGELIGKITTSRFAASGQFEGYTNAEATKRKILENVSSKGDKWFRTGDLLRQDEEGYFYFVDRIGDTFRWKGENVATSEVAEVFTGYSGVEEVIVYGVPIPGQEGKAGMAAFKPTEDLEKFDLDGLHAYLNKQLAAYSNPLFLRVLTTMQTTSTFKYTKVDVQKAGYDPSATDGDRLFFRDSDRYVPIDAAMYEKINSGKVRV
eukprot:TRINITY_DN4704_c0_g1_i1.p1 TRINITY_DN4704_c0_g1~~TRINITY_DN4704_c0_g1_i1.p1  ORF type:complete len:645 (-),score=99.92 TRINITY_DN4704_c0_g1_i1:97-2031(-)